MAAKQNEDPHDAVDPPDPTVPALGDPATTEQLRHSPSSQGETVSDTPSPATSARSTGSIMDVVCVDLKNTVEEAANYKTAGNLHVLQLQHYVQILTEDMRAVESTETTNATVRAEASKLIRTARLLRRDLDKEVIRLRILNETAEKSAPPTATEIITGVIKTASLKLPPLQPPMFDGDATQFNVFRSFFEENVFNNSDLTDTAKWLRLKECIKGRPAELISELPQDGESLDIAWTVLTKVYGQQSKPIVDLYNRLQSMPPATAATDMLRLTHTKIEGILISLARLGQDVTQNVLLRSIYLSKFPPDVMYFAKKEDDASLDEIRVELEKVITSREGTDLHQPIQRQPILPKPPQIARPLPALPAPQTSTQIEMPTKPAPNRRPNPFPKGLRCIFCDEEHWNDLCTKYPTAEARTQKVAGKCLRCLRPQHTTAQCNSAKRCFHCDGQDHNRALCPTKYPTTPTATAQLAILSNTQAKTQGSFLTFLAFAKSKNQSQPIPIRVLLDTAGGATIVNKRVAEALKLTSTSETEQYIGLNGALLSKGCTLLEPIELMTLDGSALPIQAALIQGEIPNVPAPDLEQLRRDHPHCTEVYIPPTGAGQPVDLLIGSDSMVDILKPNDNIKAINAELLLLPTKFGALIVGKQRQHQKQVCHTINFSFLSNPLQSLSDLDIVGLLELTQADIDDEEKAIQQFYDTVTFDNNRYSISWPWRTYPPLLDSHFGLALGRLRSLQKRLQKSPQILHDYHEIIQAQLREGIIEEVRNVFSNSPVIHYLPHHPVIKPEKEHSLRPVYDGSSKPSKRTKSLNENIRKGSKWLNDLVTTLIRFRKSKHVVIADIARAFHQIAINEPDRDAVRFLWLRNPDLPPTEDNLVVYRFTRVAFGIIASPFLLHAVIRHHANQQKPHPFIDIILADLYADNLVTTFDDESILEEFYDFAKQFFMSMSMNLTKWASNNGGLLQKIPMEDQQPEPVQPVLGLKWNKIDDTIAVKKPTLKLEQNPTPRTVARDMAVRFDPLGFMAPVTLLSKLFFRTVWEEYKQWDVQLNQQHTEEWAQIVEKLCQIEDFKIQRQLTTFQQPYCKELHTFVDASMSAYAIVVYLKTTKQEDVQVNLIAAKARLAPKKALSIPKLELVAILLGCKFTQYIKTALNYDEDVPTYIWSDSKCALSWMEQKKILPAVIDRHITEAKKCNISHFRYVPSNENYADVASRGADIEFLKQMKWWTGPLWLQNVHDWPVAVQFPEEDTVQMLLFHTAPTLKRKIVLEEEKTGIATISIAKHRTLNSLLMLTAYCIRAVNKLLKKEFIQLQQGIDVSTALMLWLRWDQERYYALESEPEAGKKLLLHNTNVFRDEQGLIRCQTRIVNSLENLDTVNPVLLVKKSTLTKLIILHEHTQNCHAGTSHTLAALRKSYWLPQGRREVYTVIFNNCFQCRRQTATEYPNPPPAPLPEFRVTANQRPFQVVGIDVCGPFHTRHALQRNQPKLKRWVLMFTCAVIRAVHVEVLQDMTTPEFLLAFRRFFARRGIPSKIVSDNAPQFHSLDGYFKDLWKDLSQSNAVAPYFAQNRIIWDFIPEISPWMGGMYERLIQSIKKAFERTYGNKVLLDRQFETSIIEIESIINSRPLTYVDRNPDSPILTPNDFLGAKYTAFPMNDKIQRTDDHLQKLWRSTQSHLNEFWNHWSSHYLLLLRERNDHYANNSRNSRTVPQKGDVVVMVDLSKKRSAWVTAIVERRCFSSDGQVRAVQIRIPDGRRYIRPITQLAPLKMAVDLPNVRDDQLTADRQNIVVHEFPEGATQYIEIEVEEENTPIQRIPQNRNEDSDEEIAPPRRTTTTSSTDNEETDEQ